MRRLFQQTIVLILILLLAACRIPGSSAFVDAGAQTAIIETSIAEATTQAVAFEMSQGTATPIPLPATITPMPVVDPYTLSEEELAALLDASYEEAIYNSADAADSAELSVEDGLVTEEEIFSTVYFIYESEAAILHTQELIAIYRQLYGDLAGEAEGLLVEIEGDLNELATVLMEIEDLLAQGSIVASEAIAQINASIAAIQEKVEEALNSKQAWREGLQADMDARELLFTSLAPNNIAPDIDGAVLQGYTYLDNVKAAFADQVVTRSEMDQIAQLGANARASLGAQAEPGLQILGSSIDALTRQIARGQWPQARSGIGALETALPPR